jgi:hypothetical protein
MRLLTFLALLFASGAVQAESVPLIHEQGTYLVSVLINDKISLNFTVDSGAADVSIPADVFSTLRRTGSILNGDLLDSGIYIMADGSEHRSQRFRIRSLRVGNLELKNVIGSVAPATGGLLLGQSFLERLGSWSIDYKRHALVINDSGGSSAPSTVIPTGDSPPEYNDDKVTWVVVTKTKSGNLYLDTSSIQVRDPMRRAWVASTFAPHVLPDRKDTSRWAVNALSLWAFNCDTKLARGEATYMRYNDETKEDSPFGSMHDIWHAVEPGSGTEDIWRAVCTFTD